MHMHVHANNQRMHACMLPSLLESQVLALLVHFGLLPGLILLLRNRAGSFMPIPLHILPFQSFNVPAARGASRLRKAAACSTAV